MSPFFIAFVKPAVSKEGRPGMGLKLNRVEDEILRETLPSSEARVARLRGLRESRGRADDHMRLGDALLDLGLKYYQKEGGTDEILDLFDESAVMKLRSWEFRSEHRDGYGDAYAWRKIVSPVIAFGPASNRRRIVDIPDAVVYENGPGGSSNAMLLAAIREWLATGKLGDRYAAALERCSSKGANRWEARVLLPVLKGLEAIANSDAIAWNRALATTTDEHKREALRGELQRDVQGFMNLEGIWLLRLGLERGMTCTVDSPYLPIPLVEAACRRTASSS